MASIDPVELRDYINRHPNTFTELRKRENIGSILWDKRDLLGADFDLLLASVLAAKDFADSLLPIIDEKAFISSLLSTCREYKIPLPLKDVGRLAVHFSRTVAEWQQVCKRLNALRALALALPSRASSESPEYVKLKQLFCDVKVVEEDAGVNSNEVIEGTSVDKASSVNINNSVIDGLKALISAGSRIHLNTVNDMLHWQLQGHKVSQAVVEFIMKQLLFFQILGDNSLKYVPEDDAFKAIGQGRDDGVTVKSILEAVGVEEDACAHLIEVINGASVDEAGRGKMKKKLLDGLKDMMSAGRCLRLSNVSDMLQWQPGGSEDSDAEREFLTKRTEFSEMLKYYGLESIFQDDSLDAAKGLKVGRKVGVNDGVVETSIMGAKGSKVVEEKERAGCRERGVSGERVPADCKIILRKVGVDDRGQPKWVVVKDENTADAGSNMKKATGETECSKRGGKQEKEETASKE